MVCVCVHACAHESVMVGLKVSSTYALRTPFFEWIYNMYVVAYMYLQYDMYVHVYA